jgi:general stress protein CsbA
MHQFWVALLLPFVALVVFSVVRYASWLLYPLIPQSWRRTLFTDYITGEWHGPAAGRPAKE